MARPYPRAGAQYPRSLGEFHAWFQTDADCLDYLKWLRWPSGFVCPNQLRLNGEPRSVLYKVLYDSASAIQPMGRWRCSGWPGRRFAPVRAVEIIGEAASRLSPETHAERS